MALSGTMVKQVTIMSDGDVFHEIFRYRPHHISEMSPDNIKGVNLHEGEWGTVGSVIEWDFFHDGKPKVAKEVIEAIDEEKKSVCFKVIGGDILEAYKTFLITVHVDTHGEENVVTWTFHYEKVNESIPDPDSLMEFCLNVTKDIETHHLPKCN
ncbi:putative Bet v I/Major latex protein [Helianthus annuus]|uniref:Bet v I/Major latex protein n=1 Tax=Helianthus annuus TaxID=4232 RepID=A0A251U3Q7_HELAN|nr:kirola [Helianthus annuus]KAF5793970.1 putative Bet v I/Major latex protein [Helianthus annuus]KAJ0537698.1 putative Bet v I/Major latex protein [Helianthus annuus]KAJ0552279.1 putative Bet v I/Major latex protein [Helianthus annuus]KAJ0717977.1 putative Bet v I/Major latex protein [Helianthus annuus]KAJ0896365.1 putative Bet v I/Major latex protein [Helianthus annuus]